MITGYSFTRSASKWRGSRCWPGGTAKATLAAMARKSLRVGLGQVRVTMGDKKANLAELFRFVEESARATCDVVVLPECSLAGWLSSSTPSAAETVPGPVTRRFQAAAKRHAMAIIVGLEERDGERIYNSAVMFGRDGKLLAKHRKIDELEIGLKVYSRGASLRVFEFEGREIALDICADSWK